MLVKHKINVVITDDTDGKDKLFALDDTKAEVVLSGFTKYTSGRFSVAAGASEALSLGDLTTVRALYIKADNDFGLVLNGGPAVTMKMGQPNGTARCFLECALASVTVEAPSPTATVSGIYLLYGDPAA